MEYLDGCTLAEIVSEEGALPIAWPIDILEQARAAVDQACTARASFIEIRSLHNIWLEPNGRGGYTVKVLDFGLVKLVQQEEINADQRESALISGEFSDESATLIKSESLTAIGSAMGNLFLYVARAMSRRASRYALRHLQSGGCWCIVFC